MLVKESAVIVVIAACIALLLRFRLTWAFLKSHVLPLCAACALVLAPWVIRNAVVQGEFIPLRTAFGINWWVANHPGAGGDDRTSDGKYVLASLPREYGDYMNRILPADEQDRDRTYKGEVWRFIHDHPADYARLCGKRLIWWVWFVPGHHLAGNWVYRVSWISLLATGIPGLVLAVRSRRMDAILPLILIGYVLYYVPVIVFPRYRVISAMVLLLFAAITLDSLIVLLAGLRKKSLRIQTVV